MTMILRTICFTLLITSIVIQPTDAARLRRRARCRRPQCSPKQCFPETGLPEMGVVEAATPDLHSTSKLAVRKLFDGKTLGGWKVADQSSFDAHGDVHVRDGRIELPAGSPATGIVFTGEPLRVNYELSLDAMRTDGGDFFCGLTFPVKQECCSLIVGGWGGGLVGLSNVDSMPASENETTSFQQFKDNQWYRIRLRVSSSRIEVWIDEEQLFSLRTEGRTFDIWWEQEPMRPLGIATWYTGAALRDIELRPLSPEEK
ncbi:MAG TPA: DUF1080 domain-containing protein [Pirellulales bacterium]|nr:DUF1080 domain-containing protein [Pirellulales bacterium]